MKGGYDGVWVKWILDERWRVVGGGGCCGFFG